MSEKETRLKHANELLNLVASEGRRFFRRGDEISRFELDGHGRIWFIDAPSQCRIYTHYPKLKGYGGGGTLKQIILLLRDYISSGKQLRDVLGPWPSWYCEGDVWGYGESMKRIREYAVEQGIYQ